MNDMSPSLHRYGALVEVGHMQPPGDTLDDAHKEKRWGWIVAFLFFGLFLGWAAFVRLDSAAYAMGTISVSGNRQAVQHRDGGVVSAIHVREGQHVRTGEVLIELAQTEVGAVERSLGSQVISLEAQRARLVAQQSGTAIQMPATFASLTGSEKEEARQALTLQTAELNARRRALGDQKRVLGQQAAQLSQQVGGYNQQRTTTERQGALFNDELQGMRDLARQGYASTNRVRALERAQAEVSGQMAGLSASAAAAREQIGQTRMQALGLESQMAQQTTEELRTVESTLNDLLPKYRAAKEELERTRIRATASGQVVGLDVYTVGGVIAPGQKLMEIVPDGASLVVQAQVQPNDADDLYVGQETELRIPALHERNAPVFKGKITRLSADAFTDPKSGIQYFTAEVTVPATEIEEVRRIKGGNGGLKAGLPVQVLVPLRKRTLLDYLIEPLNQTLWRSFREH